MVVLTNVSFGLLVPEAATLVIPATAARAQLKVAPGVALAGA